MTQMKQLFQNLRSGETSVYDVPVPSPQAGEVLVRTAVSLVSAGTERMLVEFGEKSLIDKARARPDLVRQMLDKARREGFLSTLEAAFNRLDQPMVLGYSSAGTIVGLGEGVSGYSIGERVACAGGGFAVHAEYATIPCNLLAPLPDTVSDEAAAFTTLGAIAMHGFRLTNVQLGERVAIIGLGLVGLLAVEIANAAGCAVLGVDIDPDRVALAQQLGATAVLRAGAIEAAQAFSRGYGCDAVLICADSASNDPVELAATIARDRATVVATGAVNLHLPRKPYYEKELTFINSRSYGPGRYDPVYEEQGRDYPIGYVRWTEGRNLQSFVDLLARRQIDVAPLISHRFPIVQAPEAYSLITGKVKEPFLGVLLTYPQQPAQENRPLDEITVQPNVSGNMMPYQVASEVKAGDCALGVLGAGNFATAVLVPAIKDIEGIERVGIASASGANAAHAARRFGFQYATSDSAQIIRDPKINTLAILTRHDLHASQILAGLAAGKHVFCEKPLAVTLADLAQIEQMLAVEPPPRVEQKSVPGKPILMVGFNRRFAPLAQRLQGFLAGRSEPLAANYRVNAGYIPLNHWVHDAMQGGRIIGEGCHFVDFISFLVGAPPSTVSAQALPDSGRYHQDNVILTFSYADGSVGVVTYLANGDKAFSKERVEVFCAGRVAVLDDFRTLELNQGGHRQVYRSLLRQDKGHHREWQQFSAAVRHAGPPPIPYDQLLGVSRATIVALSVLTSGDKVTI
jgi:predicted dehydrogenase